MFILGILFMLLFLHVLLFFFCQNHLIVTSDVIICTGYTKFANTLFRNNSKNKCIVKVKELAVSLLG